MLDRLPKGVIAFGKTVGFVINYSPDQAVRFDRNGQPIEILDKAVRPATAVLCLGRRPITAEALGWFFPLDDVTSIIRAHKSLTPSAAAAR